MNILFTILIFSLPLGVLTRINPTPGVAFYVHDLIAFSIFIMLILKSVKNKDKTKGKKLLVLALLFAAIGFLSLFINSGLLTFEQFLISFAYLVRWVIYVSIIFAAAYLSENDKKAIFLKMFFSGLIFTFAGFVQYLFYPNLRNLFYLGWDEHLYRLFSTFFDPNFAGAFLVLIFVLTFELGLQSLKKNNRYLKYGFPVAMTFIIIAVFLTYSRSAFIMLLFSVAFLLLLHKYFKWLFLSLFFLVALFFLFSNRSIEGLNPFRIVSSEARITSANEAISIFLKNPLLGVGFNSYRYAQIRYGTRGGEYALSSHADAGTDNSFLLVLVTTGAVGFVVYIDFLINIIKIAFKSYESHRIYNNVVLVSTGGLIVNSIFINSLFYSPIAAWYFILVGLMVSRKQ
jgi:O-antigen ligase